MAQDPDEERPSTSTGSWGRDAWWKSRDRIKAETSVDLPDGEVSLEELSVGAIDSTDSDMDPLRDVEPSVEMIVPEIIEEEEGGGAAAEGEPTEEGPPRPTGPPGPSLIHPGLLPRSMFDESEEEVDELIGPDFSMPAALAEMILPDPVPCIARPVARELDSSGRSDSTEGGEEGEDPDDEADVAWEPGDEDSAEEEFEVVSDVFIPFIDLGDLSAESDDSVVVVEEGRWHRRSGRLSRNQRGLWARQGEMEWHGYF